MDALVMLATWSGATILLLTLFGRRAWESNAPIPRLYLALGWALVSLGGLQMLVTPLRFPAFDENALWFATSGGAIGLTGALNLLNLARRRGEAATRRLCVAADLFITLVFLAIATHRGEEPPHDPVSAMMIVVGVAATVLARAGRSGAARPGPGPAVDVPSASG